MTIQLGVLEVGRTPEALQFKYPSYAAMVADWLEDIKSELTVYPIMDNCAFPDVQAADLWVVTGSRCAVYENHPWIEPLMLFIQEARFKGSKMLGICFGHQIMAQALGGNVVKSDKGWGVGLHKYELTSWPAQLEKAPTVLSINAYHQDQVVKIPNEAHLLASSSFCENAALWYPGFGISFQGHPEFNSEYEADLISLRRDDGGLPHEIAEPALKSLKGINNRMDWSNWFTRNWVKL